MGMGCRCYHHCSYNYSWTSRSSRFKGDRLWAQWFHPAGSRVTTSVVEVNRVVDGDTIDVTIDLGFGYSKRKIRVAGVDTPEKRTRDLEEKALG